MRALLIDRLRHLPLRRKLMVLILTVSGMVLFTATSVFMIDEVYTFQQKHQHELMTFADILSHNVKYDLGFDEPAPAQTVLASLSKSRQIVAAYLFARDGRHFADRDRPRARAVRGFAVR